jgi:hypothetical protein
MSTISKGLLKAKPRTRAKKISFVIRRFLTFSNVDMLVLDAIPLSYANNLSSASLQSLAMAGLKWRKLKCFTIS